MFADYMSPPVTQIIMVFPLRSCYVRRQLSFTLLLLCFSTMDIPPTGISIPLSLLTLSGWSVKKNINSFDSEALFVQLQGFINQLYFIVNHTVISFGWTWQNFSLPIFILISEDFFFLLVLPTECNCDPLIYSTNCSFFRKKKVLQLQILSFKITHPEGVCQPSKIFVYINMPINKLKLNTNLICIFCSCVGTLDWNDATSKVFYESDVGCVKLKIRHSIWTL